ncbi:MAG TPA: ComEC/Rec2 family competence protein, partial [Arenibacter sp.]|nr:ComEC/Rec2 family competence protein [Arenibacter sp.]
MQMLQFTTVKLSLCLIFGILTGNILHISIGISVFIGLSLLFLLGLEHRFAQNTHSLRFGFLVVLLTLAIGNLAISLTRSTNTPDHYSHFTVHEKHVYTLKIREVLKSNAFSDRYTAHVIAVDSLPVSGKILLYITKDTAIGPYEVDDEIITFTSLVPIRSLLNPYQFDYKKYLSHMGISHQAHLGVSRYLLRESPKTTLYGIAAKARVHIIKRLKREAFGEEELGIIQALLLGQRNEITEDTNTEYKNAGAFHILSLSGLHIGIILGLLHFLLRPLELFPRGKTIKLILIVLLLWGFAFLAGLSASILRAVAMFTFIAYALHLNRPTSHFNILALSLFFILLIFDPLLVFNVGFQLSYAAVFAIVWIYPHLRKYWMPKNWLLKKGWEIIAVSLAAQLGVLPITLFYFHNFPGLFVLTSLLILPPLGFILGMGIVVIFLALINNLPSFMVIIYDMAIRGMNDIIAWVSQQESFLFRNISFDGVQLILLYGTIICLRS